VTITLEDIPELGLPLNTSWQVKVLVVEGRNPVKTALLRWKKENQRDYKAILKVLRLTAQQYRVQKQEHVKKSANADHGEIYEARAHKGTARLMFFYEEGSQSLIICTHEYEKGRGDQDASFARCAAFKDLYESKK